MKWIPKKLKFLSYLGVDRSLHLEILICVTVIFRPWFHDPMLLDDHMEGCMKEQMVGWMREQMEGQKKEQMQEEIEGQTAGQTERQSKGRFPRNNRRKNFGEIPFPWNAGVSKLSKTPQQTSSLLLTTDSLDSAYCEYSESVTSSIFALQISSENPPFIIGGQRRISIFFTAESRNSLCNIQQGITVDGAEYIGRIL